MVCVILRVPQLRGQALRCEIMSVLAHTTQEMARLYGQRANRNIMAKKAMKKWNKATNESG